MLHACHSSPRTHHSPWLSTSADATTYRIHTLKTARAAAPAATLSRPASLRGSIAVSHFGMHPCPTRLPARTCLAELCAKSRVGKPVGGRGGWHTPAPRTRLLFWSPMMMGFWMAASAHKISRQASAKGRPVRTTRNRDHGFAKTPPLSPAAQRTHSLVVHGSAQPERRNRKQGSAVLPLHHPL